MSEYDYSPEAFERHLATQRRIERWVDQTREQSPANPFMPLPGEYSDAQTPHPHPHPAFYATPEGVISPTYSHSPRHYEHRHNSSPRGTPVVMPPGYRPVAGRSFSTPPVAVRNYYPLPSTPYPTSSPLNSSPYASPYGSPYQSSPVSFPSYSQASLHLVPAPPHIYVNPVQPPHEANTYPYFPTPPPQPVVVVNRGGGGYVVVPPPVQHVQASVCIFFDYHTFFVVTHSFYFFQGPSPVYAHSFFGRLKSLGGKHSRSKKSKRSRRDSY